jgi:hypothetical protein
MIRHIQEHTREYTDDRGDEVIAGSVIVDAAEGGFKESVVNRTQAEGVRTRFEKSNQKNHLP